MKGNHKNQPASVSKHFFVQNEFIIHIKPDGAITTEDITDGITSFRNISPDDLAGALRRSIIKDNIWFSSSMLPKNCVSYNCNEKGNKYVLTEFNTGYADITYMNTSYKHFPLPKMVFGFNVNDNNNITSINIGITANEPLTESSQMFIYPFSNVNVFGLCTGANQLPSLKSLYQLTNMPWYILGLPNNNDNYTERNNALRLSHRELMEYMKNKDLNHYYEKVLIPMEHKTLKDFIKY